MGILLYRIHTTARNSDKTGVLVSLAELKHQNFVIKLSIFNLDTKKHCIPVVEISITEALSDVQVQINTQS